LSGGPGAGLAIEIPDPAERCQCGTSHRVETQTIVVAEDANEQLASFAASQGWRDAVLIMDPNTEEAAGSRVARELEGAGVRVVPLRFPNRTGLRADGEALAAARESIRRNEGGGVVAVGSGVITDITRYAAHLEDRGFVSVPTAASMDGYASGVAAMELGGVKVTFPARAPQAIFADPVVIAAAPPEMTRSGLGDLLGKATARTDWLAAHLLYGETFCPEADARVLAPLTYAAKQADAVLSGEPAAIERLLEGLVQSGIAMAMMGNSRPASGCEHLASHFWDLLAARGLRRHAPHGLQVGYATQFAMRLQRFAFAGGVPTLATPHAHELLGAGARDWLGEPASEIVDAMAEKRDFVVAGAAHWPGQGRWEALRSRVAAALELFPTVETAFAAAEIPPEPGFLGVDAPILRATFRYACRLRARYTVLDFLEGQGVLEDALDVALGGAYQRA
jgi:glycerol-1-phosphate dehydrogenase [NAD(P)+]